MRTLALLLALVAAPALAHAEPRLDGGQAERGFVVAARLGTEIVTLNTTATSAQAFNALRGGIFAGYKIRRFIFGLGLDLDRVAYGSSSTGNVSSASSSTSILVTPGLSVAIVRSADRRVELFGQLDLGFGTIVGDSVPQGTDVFRFAYDVGPGLRYWVHPQFAFGALAGVAGTFVWATSSQNAMSTTSSSGLTSIFAQLQVMGVF